MNISAMQYILFMSIYFLVLIFIIGFMRKHRLAATVIWILSLLTIPLWINGGVIGWFRWAKILSVIVPIIVVCLCRLAYRDNLKGKLWEIFRKPKFQWFFYGILFLNILEATLKDISLGNYANAACGFLLCVTIPFPTKYWVFEKSDNGDVLIYTSFAWNFLYTTWNLCFVYGESPNYFASSACILLAALLYSVFKRREELYIMARIYTLATHMIVRACLGGLVLTLIDSSSWFNATVLNYWGILNLILIIPFVFWNSWKLYNDDPKKSIK